MPSSSPDSKVLIVGGGPTGLSLALFLLKQNIQVRVIEKFVKPIPGQRGAGLHPRTYEIFESVGILNKIMEKSVTVPKVRIYKLPGGKEVLREVEMVPSIAPTPETPYPVPKFLGQNLLEEILRDELRLKYNHDFEHGTELKTLEEKDDSVKVTLQHHDGSTEEAAYQYVIGADGGKGNIRKILGLPFVGETREERIVVGDFKITGLSDDRIHHWGEMSDIVLKIRATETPGLFTLYMGGHGFEKYADSVTTQESLQSLIKVVTGGREDILLTDTIWMGPYRVNVRMVPAFSKGRVFLAGDAAHIHSSAGGQGLNTGVHDAYNLAWKLALVLKGLSPPSLLDTYNIERLPIVAEMLNITTELFNKTVAKNANHDDTVFQRTGKLNQLGVNYRSSPIVVDAGEKDESVSAYGGGPGGHVRGGDRVPDVAGLVRVGGENSTRLFNLLDPTVHTVMIFGNTSEVNTNLLAKFPKDLVRYIAITRNAEMTKLANVVIGLVSYEDREGHANRVYGDLERLGTILVIRPDGYVGARLKNLDEIYGYFEGIFCVKM
ncbi:FAD binding domain-containing protein [Crepidotus variabilis]|uniref:FAD binding domain-containing protein n=1 Tax=Crepidotus variabilis TaxID=179855 RepID=A0A9P6JM38_9AGAR|nr:FAD binding domain-containing protein [Crepidotus variabilis]